MSCWKIHIALSDHDQMCSAPKSDSAKSLLPLIGKNAVASPMPQQAAKNRQAGSFLGL